MRQPSTDPEMLAQQLVSAKLPAIGENNNVPIDEGRIAPVEALVYQPVPPRNTVSVRVRYRVRGRGRIMPFWQE